MRWWMAGSMGVTLLSEAAHARADLPDQLSAIPGMTVVEEQAAPAPGFRFFVLSFAQPIDHHHASRGTFQEWLTLLHRSESAPTVAFTSGYGWRVGPSRHRARLSPHRALRARDSIRARLPAQK